MHGCVWRQGTAPRQCLQSCFASLLNYTALHCTAGCRERYEKAITHGSDKHATQYERERGALAAGRLRQETGPYMLRREKKEVFQAAGDTPAGGTAEGAAATAGAPAAAGDAAAAAAAGGGGGAKPAAMPHKNDLIVWLKLQPMQRKVYQAFLNSGGWVGWWIVGAGFLVVGAECSWVLSELRRWVGGPLALCCQPCQCLLLHSSHCHLCCPAHAPACLAHPHTTCPPPAHHLQTL